MEKVLILLMVLPFSNANNIEYDGVANIKLMHAFNGNSQPVFSERGNISIVSLRLGQALINQKPLSADERQLLCDLAIANKYYQLKSIIQGQDGGSSMHVSYIKACMLAEAELTDILTVTLDYSGNVISVVALVASTSTCEGAYVDTNKLLEFSTSVHVKHTYNGPSPDTASYIQKLDREREARDRGEVKDNRSFLAKYWMYIVPVVIIMVLSSVTNQEVPTNSGR